MAVSVGHVFLKLHYFSRMLTHRRSHESSFSLRAFASALMLAAPGAIQNDTNCALTRIIPCAALSF